MNSKISANSSVSDYQCSDCPRNCGALRGPEKGSGFCASPGKIGIARAAPHFGEEPCISGSRGAGTIFFTGCNLRCVFCQNYEISRNSSGFEAVSVEKLKNILLSLRDQGVHNIDLVTPTHYTRQIAEALSGIDLGIPVVWNSSGYESVETLKMLDGLVQVYMPDYKYASSALAKRYSAAENYPEAAAEALKEMYRQRGPYKLDENGMLISGLLIRHLILPGGRENTENSMDVIDFVADTFPTGSVLFSLMSQYTPMPASAAFPELTQFVTQETNDMLVHYMHTRHLEDGYWQELAAATTEMIPDFNGTGVT
ncbi:MAG: radical SAM protein [Eubacteriales bacterium]|nr:radical SAM protein [Eubacteriales bacterium]